MWQECFGRWTDLCATIAQTSLASASGHPRREQLIAQEVGLQNLLPLYLSSWITQEDFVQWRNLTLFLAAFSGVCCQENYNSSALQTIVPQQILPDDMRVLKNPQTLVERFIKDLTDFLIADSTKICEVAREALGTELSPSLYGVLFKHLEE